MPHDDRSIRVEVTSIDGNLTHEFKRSDTVGEVHRLAYDRLVRDKTTVPFTATTIEFNSSAVSDSEKLGTLLPPEDQHGRGNPGPSNDRLKLALTWVSQGG